MPSSTQYWTFLGSSSSLSDFQFFTYNLNVKPETSHFSLIAEELIQPNTTRSSIGATLAIAASRYALTELEDKELSFTSHFFKIFSESWKTKVFLHASQKPFANEPLLSIDQLLENEALGYKILQHYDVSVGLVYLKDNQLTYLQSAYSQLALLNDRYNCDIKKADKESLVDILLHSTNNTAPYQFVDIEKYRLEMLVLLPSKYTTTKTGARLKSNILKIYRSFVSNADYLQDAKYDPSLIILKRNNNQKPCQVAITEKSPPAITSKVKAKKSLATYYLSSFLLLLGISASYFLWQAQAKENISLPLVESNQKTLQLAANITQEAGFPKKEPLEDTSIKQLNLIKKQEEEREQRLQQEHREAERLEKKALAEKKQEAELVAKKTQERLEKQKEIEAQTETLRLKALEENRIREEERLIEQQKEREAVAIKERQLQQKREEEVALLKQQNDDESLLSIQRDIDIINRHDNKLRAQRQAEEQKQRENQAKLVAEKQAKKKRKEALIKQRRLEFENSQARKEQASRSTGITSSQNNKAKAQATNIIEPQNRKEKQRQNQQHIKQKEAEKKRVVAEELKKQQVGQLKAKEERTKLIQQTVVHQLVNYSKTFNRHAVQLQQKITAIELLEKRKSSNSAPKTIRDKERLQSKKIDIEQRIDRLAGLYSSKLKKLCAYKVIHSVAIPAKPTNVERIALSVITQQLRTCSQAQTLSRKNIARTLINRYLKQ